MSNAIYNAARHTIESRDGAIVLATLHPSVRADHAFQIADSWQGPAVEDYERLEEDLEIQCEKTGEAEADAEMFKNMYRNADYDLKKANARIEELEAELAELKEKGAPDA